MLEIKKMFENETLKEDKIVYRGTTRSCWRKAFNRRF